jgi:hypothetical protein
MDFKVLKEVDADNLEPGLYVLATRDYINEEYTYSPLNLPERCKVLVAGSTHVIIEKV